MHPQGPGTAIRLSHWVVAATAFSLVVIACTFGLSLDASRQLDRSASERERAEAAEDAGNRALRLVLDLETGARGYLITGDQRFLAPWRSARRQLAGALSNFRVAGARAGEGDTAELFDDAATSYLRDYSEPLLATAADDLEAARAIVRAGDGKLRTDRLRKLVTEASRRVRALAAVRDQSARRASARAMRVQTAGLVVLVLLVCGFLALLMRGVLRPIRATVAAARALRSGDLGARVPHTHTHELAELSAAFNEMAAELQAGQAELQARNEELEASRQEADAANQAKSEFLSRMSHELRTPLNAVLGFAQILELDELTPDQRETTLHILKAGRHLLELINEILDLARIESNDLNVSLEPVCVTEIVEETLAMMAPLATARRVALREHLGACGELHVLADRQRLKQVMLNLVANAVKYNREGGTVEVRCEAGESDRVAIVVADTGIGIAAHDLDRLFDPFVRVHGDDPAIESTGLGLALTRRLVEAMDGAIHVSSKVGEGSVFAIELALTEGPADRVVIPEAPEARIHELSRQSASPRTVLYIEDNASNVKLVERVLARRPEVKLMIAMQATLGLELALQHAPDLVLLDLDLPDMPGDEVLRRLRADSRTARIPIAIVSADATSRQIERLKALGADEYLSKPYDVARLLSVVDAVAVNGDLGSEPSPAGDSEDHPVLDGAFLRELSRLGSPDRAAGDFDFGELVRLFTLDGEGRLAEMRAAVADGDAARVARLAHALVGSAGSVGAARLVDAARAVEEPARLGRLPAGTAIEGLDREFEAARSALAQALPRLVAP